MNNTPHTQLSENLIVVDREWLENEIERTKSGIYDAHLVLKAVRDKSYPLTPILEKAWSKGKLSQWNHYDPIDRSIMITKLEQDKQSYLSQPLILKKK